MRLRDVLPREASQNGGEFEDCPFHKYLDNEVIENHDGETPPRWMGFKTKNILNWWALDNGKAVGWNESPSRGWSFPVVSMPKESK